MSTNQEPELDAAPGPYWSEDEVDEDPGSICQLDIGDRGKKDGPSLKDLKESHPIEVAEYATMHQLNSGPAFEFWVPHVLSNCDGTLCHFG